MNTPLEMLSDEVIRQRLAYAYQIAEGSPDPSNQNGAVVYNPSSTHSGLMSTGFNHFYDGIPPEVADRKIKYERIVHAEHDAVLSLADCDDIVDRYTVMYCPWAACKPCAMAIIGSGIKRLVVHEDRCEAYAATRAGLLRSDGRQVTRHWQPHIDEAIAWLAAAGVDLIIYRGPIEEYEGHGIMINEKLWNPATCKFQRDFIGS